MESIRKKAGYLEGLFEAMKKDEKSPETMLQQGVISLLSELTERVEAMDDLLGELNDYVESIDDDLSQMEGMHDMDDDFDMMAYPDEDILRNSSVGEETIVKMGERIGTLIRKS